METELDEMKLGKTTINEIRKRHGLSQIEDGDYLITIFESEMKIRC